MTNFVRENKKIFFYGAVIILGIWLGTKFFGNDDNITYITEKVQRQNIQKVVNAAGEVRAIQLVTVGAQVSGKIETLYVTVGQVVKRRFDCRNRFNHTAKRSRHKQSQTEQL